MRKAVLALAGIVCVAAALVWLAGRSSRQEASSAAEVGDAPLAPPTLVLSDPADMDEPRVEVEGVAAARAPLAEAPGASKVASALLRLSGTVVVVDGFGEERLAENGRFQLLLRTGNRNKGYLVEVERGAWELEVPARVGGAPADALGVDAFVMGGRKALGENAPSERLAIPQKGRLELRVRWEKRLVLHVRESDSAKEVAALLTPPEVSTGHELEHPGIVPADVLGRPERSPIERLAPLEGSNTLYLRSRGHAWQRLEFGPEQCERMVELEPGGDLALTVEGPLEDARVQLRLFRGSSTSRVPLAEIPLGDRRSFQIEGLPLGTLEVGAYLGDWWQPRVLDRVEVEILTGKTTAATLTLKEPGDASWVPLQGTLRMPAAWEFADFELHLTLQGVPPAGWAGEIVLRKADLQPLGGVELFRWSARVQPGTYGATLPDTGYFLLFEVGPEGRSDVSIEVPRPGVVYLRCTDESGGEARVESVDWGYLTERSMLPARDPVQRDPLTGRWTFRAPLGRLLIRAHTADDTQQLSADIVAGANEIELRMPRPMGVQPILKDGASEVPWPTDRLAKLEPSEGQAAPPLPILRRSRLTLHAKEPGLYRLVVPEISGYERVPEELVRVEQGVMKTHVVVLRRRSGR